MKKLILLFSFYSCFATSSRAQWTQINLNPSLHFYNLQFVNDSVGFNNSQHTILKTSNRGLSWDTIYSDTTIYIFDIFFFNDSTGYFSGGFVAPPYSHFLNKT